jgi:asparagine synthase (glutamine-hydrolysing)
MLSGDGGDELFYGYERYKYLDLFVTNRGVIGYSRPLLKLVLNFIEMFGIQGSVIGRLRRNLPKIIDNNLFNLNEKDLYFYLMSNFNSHELTTGSSLNFPRGINFNGCDAKSMRKIDLVNYMIDDILVKVDRAAMHNNVEGRIPLLDNHVKSVVFGMSDKTNNIVNRKAHLKNILGEKLDLKLFNRPKMGFGIPLSQMLRNDLKELALDNLNKSFFDNFSEVYKTNVAVKLVNEFFDGTDGSEYLVWNLLMFKLWHDQWGN